MTLSACATETAYVGGGEETNMQNTDDSTTWAEAHAKLDGWCYLNNE